MSRGVLQSMLDRRDPSFWDALASESRSAVDIGQILPLITWRKRASKLLSPPPGEPVRVAMLGGYTLSPLRELLEHFLFTRGSSATVLAGKYDNYIPEILEPTALVDFRPDVVLVLPSTKNHSFSGALTDPKEEQLAAAHHAARGLLSLCEKAHEATGSEIVLGNFFPSPDLDPGPLRNHLPGTDWLFRRLINLDLGLEAPSFVHILDLDFIATRMGALAARDLRGWYESKQCGSPPFLVECAREASLVIASLRRPTKKVLVTDLDNTLWGGVIGDDGLTGIELGTLTPRGEAFRDFQAYLKALSQRGVLLAVCSKNDDATAREVFEKHPEMILRLSDFVSFRANWEPKPHNIEAVARELNLGLDSFVFVDDNPAEIEIVRQFLPQVSSVALGEDPALFRSLVQSGRFFEPRSLTSEDARRTEQYQAERARSERDPTQDMETYLRSLQMKATVSELVPADVPRVTQLINKSNQFNLTTRRKTETEVGAILESETLLGFSVRLTDRFGDNGLVSVVILEKTEQALEIETWLMSCRVLSRQVEHVVLNEIARLARVHGAERIVGTFIPTAKNDLVKNHYPSLGFEPIESSPNASRYALSIQRFTAIETSIEVHRGSS